MVLSKIKNIIKNIKKDNGIKTLKISKTSDEKLKIKKANILNILKEFSTNILEISKIKSTNIKNSELEKLSNTILKLDDFKKRV